MLKVITKVIASKWQSWESNPVTAQTYMPGGQSPKKQMTELIFLRREMKGTEGKRKEKDVLCHFVTLS